MIRYLATSGIIIEILHFSFSTEHLFYDEKIIYPQCQLDHLGRLEGSKVFSDLVMKESCTKVMTDQYGLMRQMNSIELISTHHMKRIDRYVDYFVQGLLILGVSMHSEYINASLA